MGSPASMRRISGRREVAIDIGLTRRQGCLDTLRSLFLDVLHVREALGAQQLFGHVLGALTNARDLHHPQPRRLGRRLGAEASRIQSECACSSHERESAYESSSTQALALLTVHG